MIKYNDLMGIVLVLKETIMVSVVSTGNVFYWWNVFCQMGTNRTQLNPTGKSQNTIHEVILQ